MKFRLSLALAAVSVLALSAAGVAWGTDVGGTGGPGTGHEHPVGASPFRSPLVPAFKTCTSPNAIHQPFSYSSCSPPMPQSSLLAVGPTSLGFTQWTVLGSGACASFDPSHCYPDWTIRIRTTDVRAGSPTGPLFNGNLTLIGTIPDLHAPSSANATFQTTDAANKLNVTSGACSSSTYNCSGTTVEYPFYVPVSCSSGTCTAQTTVNTLIAGSLLAGKRSIWQKGVFSLMDPGGNGVAGDFDDQVFETEGLYQP